jgi:hypothetical protein
MNSPILITGCSRSGTSVVAGVINLCGAFGGNISNPKMYENKIIKEEITISYLKKLNVDLLGQYPLPDVNCLLSFRGMKKKVEQIIIEDGYEKGVWMVKDTKMSLVWPIWNTAFPHAKWIIVRRRTGDIIDSCLKTGFMRSFHDVNNQKAVEANGEKEGWLWWIHQHEKRFIEMIEAGLNCKVIWPERMVNGDFEQMKEIINWLKLKWNPECVKFINTKLWKSKMKGETNKWHE